MITSGSAGLPTVTTKVACADGSCCPFDGAICGLNGQNFPDRDYHAGHCGHVDEEEDDGVWWWPF